jgi:hypothetical protein
VPRGGKRDGAGRPVGVRSAKTIRRRGIAERALVSGDMPLDIMLANMRYFQKLAESAEAATADLTAEAIAGLQPAEQFKRLLAEVKKAAGFERRRRIAPVMLLLTVIQNYRR